jgi:hypothetical protein
MLALLLSLLPLAVAVTVTVHVLRGGGERQADVAP